MPCQARYAFRHCFCCATPYATADAIAAIIVAAYHCHACLAAGNIQYEGARYAIRCYCRVTPYAVGMRGAARARAATGHV